MQVEVCSPQEEDCSRWIWHLPLVRHLILVKLAILVSNGSNPCQFYTHFIYHIALADANSLGINTNVTFDEVGGSDVRKCNSYVLYFTVYLHQEADINSLK